MNPTLTDTPAEISALPDTQRELELLLEALRALSDTLDRYADTEQPAEA